MPGIGGLRFRRPGAGRRTDRRRCYAESSGRRAAIARRALCAAPLCGRDVHDRRHLALLVHPYTPEAGYDLVEFPAVRAWLSRVEEQPRFMNDLQPVSRGTSAGCRPIDVRPSTRYGFDGFAIHLAGHHVMLWAVSRAPLDKLRAYKQRMGWSFPAGLCSTTLGFNFDFDASLTEQQRQAPTTTSAASRLNRPSRHPPRQPLVRGRPPRARTGPPTRGNRPGGARSRLMTASSTTRTPRTHAGSMRSGACTSGSTGVARAQRDARRGRPSTSSDGATSTTATEISSVRKNGPCRCKLRQLICTSAFGA